jgi:hypothetical protein
MLMPVRNAMLSQHLRVWPVPQELLGLLRTSTSTGVADAATRRVRAARMVFASILNVRMGVGEDVALGLVELRLLCFLAGGSG